MSCDKVQFRWKQIISCVKNRTSKFSFEIRNCNFYRENTFEWYSYAKILQVLSTESLFSLIWLTLLKCILKRNTDLFCYKIVVRKNISFFFFLSLYTFRIYFLNKETKKIIGVLTRALLGSVKDPFLVEFAKEVSQLS